MITSHPQDVHAVWGRWGILKVKADGARPLRYQWYTGSHKLIPGTYVYQIL